MAIKQASGPFYVYRVIDPARPDRMGNRAAMLLPAGPAGKAGRAGGRARWAMLVKTWPRDRAMALAARLTGLARGRAVYGAAPLTRGMAGYLLAYADTAPYAGRVIPLGWRAAAWRADQAANPPNAWPASRPWPAAR